jgi:hypothetical protein
MGASSVTGAGSGATNQPTTKELSRGPRVVLCGIAPAGSFDLVSSPPMEVNAVTFQTPLPGPAASYCVFLTTKNGGAAYVTAMHEANGNFTGVSIVAESECDVMYMVTTIGSAL